MPDSTIDLEGTWTTCKDDLFHDAGTVTWPGEYTAHSLWRNIAVPATETVHALLKLLDAGIAPR